MVFPFSRPPQAEGCSWRARWQCRAGGPRGGADGGASGGAGGVLRRPCPLCPSRPSAHSGQDQSCSLASALLAVWPQASCLSSLSAGHCPQCEWGPCLSPAPGRCQECEWGPCCSQLQVSTPSVTLTPRVAAGQAALGDRVASVFFLCLDLTLFQRGFKLAFLTGAGCRPVPGISL